MTENLPPEPQEGTKTLRLPKSVVEKQTPLQLEVVENLPLTSFLLRKSKTMAEIKAWLQKMWSRIDHLLLTYSDSGSTAYPIFNSDSRSAACPIFNSVILGGGYFTLPIISRECFCGSD